MKLVLCILLIVFWTNACHKKEEIAVKLGCDCDGLPFKVLDNALARHYKGSISIFDPEHLQQGWIIGSGIYCNPEFVKGKVNEIDTVYVSGNLRAPCNYGDWNYLSRLEVTAIRRK